MVSLNLGASLGRAKRAGPFSPQNIQGLIAWYDATDSSTITQSGGLVTQLNDKSGNARHIGNTGTSRPSVNSGYIGFNGTSQYLYNSSPVLYPSGTYAIYAVIDGTPSNYGAVVAEGCSTLGSTSYCPVMTGAGGANGDIVPYIVNDASSVVRSNTSLGAVSHVAGTKKIIRVYEKNALITSYVDGTMGTTPRSYTRATFTIDRFAIGARLNNGTGFFGNFKLYEMIIVNSDNYGRQIEGYLAAKHGITANLPAGHPYKTRVPLKGQTTSYPIEKTAAPLTTALMGDSITAFNTVVLPDINAYHASGYFTNYGDLSRQRMFLPVSYNKGNSGERTSQMVSRMATDLGPLTFDRCFLLGGTNDISNGDSQDTTRDNLDNLLNYITITKGKTAILLTIMPRTHGSDVANSKAKILALNDFILKSHGSREGRVIAIDVYTTLNDGNNEPIANATYDGLHPTSYGAMLLGRDIHTQLLPYYGTGAGDFSTGNLLANSSMAGTSGTAGSNASGSVATSYTLTGTGGTGGRTASKNGDGSQRLTMAVTGGISTDKMTLTQTITSGFSSGDILYAMALVEVVGTSAKINRNGLELNLTTSQTLNRTTAMDQGSGPIAEQYITPGIYLLRTPDLTLSVLPTAAQWKYEMQGDSTAGATSGAVNILAAGIFKH